MLPRHSHPHCTRTDSADTHKMHSLHVHSYRWHSAVICHLTSATTYRLIPEHALIIEAGDRFRLAQFVSTPWAIVMFTAHPSGPEKKRANFHHLSFLHYHAIRLLF